MPENSTMIPEQSTDNFGMTQEEMKNYKYKNFLGIIGYYFAKIEPFFAKILNAIIYYFFKFIKAFFKTVIEMIKGGA